ncbi:Aspartyl/asparaginyl beta-hydroxylase [Collichthys lucidus]|uniref:Aspartyl/asparaginyl beta-hydroxylase n=1 Tax=Collichthys lucidus TaxID=240159 RepID=A0A4U5VH10_COLLU|nr:Aspartyl/asparaginyl beta-hydroxylase [Collichthys lucidus]
MSVCVADDPRDSAHPYEDQVDTIDTTGVLLEEPPPPEDSVGTAEKQAEEKLKDKAKKKKPKLLNKFDKTIKAEIDAAEKLRKKGKSEEALRAFETLVQQHPQSPRARYGKAQKAINTYREAAELPDVTSDLLRAALKRRAERQQFLGNEHRRLTQKPLSDREHGNTATRQHFSTSTLQHVNTSTLQHANTATRQHCNTSARQHVNTATRQHGNTSTRRMRGSLATLEKLTQIFPEDIGLKNELGVAHLLLGDNKGAKKVYEEVLAVASSNGFAKVHYGFILKSENKIAESIPYLKRSLYNVAGLKAQPWWTAKETGYIDLVKTLERNWKTIRDEALAVMDQNTGLFIPEDENLRERGELRMHLGLVIPKHGCRIRCTDQTREWDEGKVLIFDDSFEHEVWQDADSYRLIFIVDVWHPELTAYQRQTLSPI